MTNLPIAERFIPLCLGSGVVNALGTVYFPTEREPCYVTLTVTGVHRWPSFADALDFVASGGREIEVLAPAPRHQYRSSW